jgi:hypothetical protein
VRRGLYRGRANRGGRPQVRRDGRQHDRALEIWERPAVQPPRRPAGVLEIPLPASTQWDIVKAVEGEIAPAFAELVRQAAQGDVLYNDDTTVKILALMGAQPQARAAEAGDDADERTGLYTSGVVALRDGHHVALFFSGRRHAGENLAEVLQHRAKELPPPIQMCDALSRNLPGELQTIVAHCLAHARRQFVDVHDRFPEHCNHLLEALAVVYHNDAQARERGLSPEARLQFHQEASQPTMQDLHAWLNQQRDDKLVEPNSALGGAIGYMLRHWEKLTLFLRQAGAPLGRVETWRGGLGRAYRFPALSSAGASLAPPCSVSTSRSSNRTCRSPASGSHSEPQAFAFDLAVRLAGT